MRFVLFPKEICYVNPIMIREMVDLRPVLDVPKNDEKYAFGGANIDSQRLNGERYSGLLVPDSYLRIKKTKFRDDTHVKALEDRFLNGKPWIETAYGTTLYEGWYKKIFEGAFKNSSFEDFENHRLREWDNIYLDIKENGFRQSEDAYDNIEVSVASNGNLLFVDGRHRLYFAQILGVVRVPVIVNHWSVEFARKHNTLNGKKLKKAIESIQ